MTRGSRVSSRCNKRAKVGHHLINAARHQRVPCLSISRHYLHQIRWRTCSHVPSCHRQHAWAALY